MKEYGHCFEHFVIQELKAYIGYTHNDKKPSYWHTYNGKEIARLPAVARNDALNWGNKNIYNVGIIATERSEWSKPVFFS